MSSTVSVSKGVFVFKNGAKASSKKGRKKKSVPTEALFSDKLWYCTYKSLWNSIEEKLQNLNEEMFSHVLNNLVSFIGQCYSTPVSEIPSAALMTGINMPDHAAQFHTLRREIKQYITPHVVTLKGEDCPSLKNLVENMLNQLINCELSDEDDSDIEANRVKKSQCSFSVLQSWYEDLYMTTKPKKKNKKKSIVVIVPDFENFSPKVLQDLISIASSYINVLPFVFVFGVATSLTTLHRSLPYHVSCKVKIQIFNSTPSTEYLNNFLENILFSSDCPFHLGGNIFNLFSDIFLFYDLSVSGFVQNVKYAMLEHFSHGNAMALCRISDFKSTLSQFSHDDFENVRRLLSFRKFVENAPPEARLKLLTDDVYFQKTVKKQLRSTVKYLSKFHLFLKCLCILVSDLPGAPLGKQVRQLYAVAVSQNITETPQFTECFKLLEFQSKGEFSEKICRISGLLFNNVNKFEKNREEIEEVIAKFREFVEELTNSDLIVKVDEAPNADNVISGQMDRKQLKEKLMSMSKQGKSLNQYEKLRRSILEYLLELFRIYLPEPTSLPFHEIFFFNDMSIQSRIIGAHRAAIHSALSNPQYYLQCTCCEIADDLKILPSMPDISIAYKLHLECGKMINLYDWLQAFVSVISPQEMDDDSNLEISPQLQARFTQAVAELEYLGFIKSSKRKTDHVARLTWGG